MQSSRAHTAHAAQAIWVVVFAILVTVFIASLAVWIVVQVENPSIPTMGKAQHQSNSTALRRSTARVRWRDHVDVGSSEVIQLSLTNPRTKKLITCQRESTLPQPGGSYEQAVSAVGTPGVPLAAAFGPNYAGYATAHLAATSFDAAPTGTDEESLDQSHIAWGWVISPKSSGQQYAVTSITGTWRPCFGAGATIQRQLWVSQPLTIAVDQPLLQRNSFDLVSFLTGTTGLSSALLYGLRVLWRWVEQRSTPAQPPQGNGSGGQAADTNAAT